jgi:hypothetical protein
VLTARLLTVDGTALPATVAGSMDITADPPLGYFTDQAELTDAKGATATWTAPEQAGEYTFTARYGGATSYAMFGSHTAAGAGTVTVTVGTLHDAGVDAEPIDGAGDDDAAGEEPADAATTAAASDAAPIDWPGTWKGKMKTSMVTDGTSVTDTQEIELTVKVGPGDQIRIVTTGYPDTVLTRTPSNPRAATGTQILPRPPSAGSTVKRWDATNKWTAFLADGKLNLAMHLEIHQTVVLDINNEVVNSSMVSDSIGQLELVR